MSVFVVSGMMRYINADGYCGVDNALGVGKFWAFLPIITWSYDNGKKNSWISLNRKRSSPTVSDLGFQLTSLVSLDYNQDILNVLVLELIMLSMAYKITS